MIILLISSILFASEIQIRDVTYLSSESILLKDIALFKDVNSEDEKTLGNIVLANDLKVGVERVFSKDSLVSILKRFQKKNQRTIFVIPETALVKRQEDHFSKKNVEDKIAKILEASNIGLEAKVDAIGFPVLSGLILDWEVNVPSQLQANHAVIPVLYTVRQNGKDIEKRESITVKVKLFQVVPVVKENTFTGQRIAEDQIEMQKVEVNRNQLFVSNPKDIIGRKIKRNLRQGEAIRSTDLEKEYSVRAGESVYITVQENDIFVRLQGIAKQNVSIGDVIRVTNPMNNQLVFGKVTGSREVEIK